VVTSYVPAYTGVVHNGSPYTTYLHIFFGGLPTAFEDYSFCSVTCYMTYSPQLQSNIDVINILSVQ